MCEGCGQHFNIPARKRIQQIFDRDSFVEQFDDVETKNQLEFNGYEDKLKINREKSKLDEAVVTGMADINSVRVATAVMDSNFMMGSMGCAVGEKITRTIRSEERRVGKEC